MLPSPANVSGGGGKKKLTSTTPSSSLVTPPPVKKKEDTHSGGLEDDNSKDVDSIFHSIFQAYKKDCEDSGWTLNSDKLSE
jgi:hypothetical protein